MKIRLSSIIVPVSFVLFVFTITSIIWFLVYTRDNKNRQITIGNTITSIVADLIYAEDLEYYLNNGEDESYIKFENLLSTIKKTSLSINFYILKFVKDGAIFIFDADKELPLGYLDPWNKGFPDYKKKDFLNGATIKPEIYNSNFGTFFTIHKQVHYKDGSIAKGYYIAADFVAD
jgi:hypothetical protein